MIAEIKIIKAIESENIPLFNSLYRTDINHSLLRNIDLNKIIRMGSLTLIRNMIKHYCYIQKIDEYLYTAKEYPEIYDFLCKERDSFLQRINEEKKMNNADFLRYIMHNNYSTLVWRRPSVPEEVFLEGVRIAIEKNYINIVSYLVHNKNGFVPYNFNKL